MVLYHLGNVSTGNTLEPVRPWQTIGERPAKAVNRKDVDTTIGHLLRRPWRHAPLPNWPRLFTFYFVGVNDHYSAAAVYLSVHRVVRRQSHLGLAVTRAWPHACSFCLYAKPGNQVTRANSRPFRRWRHSLELLAKWRRWRLKGGTCLYRIVLIMPGCHSPRVHLWSIQGHADVFR